MGTPYKVVFVCTGNRARSPLAEALYRRYSEGESTVTTSYGTRDVGPASPLPQSVDAATRLGIDLSGHRARALHQGALADSDLVLGFELFHIAAAVFDGGASAANTFLLGEVVRLLETQSTDLTGLDRAHAVVEVADAMRVRSRPDEAGVVVDPVGKPDEVMARVALQIDDLVQRLVRALLGASLARYDGSATDEIE